ncbi:MAG TPA: hypothetical protein VKE70_16360 [Candidatus Solibacter sp.]|nr:hypothetical protein [Candidatus Solibacter sp.]
MIRLLSTLVLLLLTVCFAANSAVAIDVTYSVTGSPGAWDLNFTVQNNLSAWPTQDIYHFGVLLSAPGITGSPAGYDPNAYASWTNFFNGGSSLVYNNIWYDGSDFNHLLPGTSLSGFIVEIADATAPTSVPWFAYTVTSSFDPADLYDGTEAFAIDSGFLTAGFEGTAVTLVPAASAPEPSALAFVITGLMTCAIVRRMRRRV